MAVVGGLLGLGGRVGSLAREVRIVRYLGLF